MLAELRGHGLAVPTHMPVLAVASSRVASIVHPPISAADVPAEEMGRHAVEMLLRLLASPSAPLARVLLSTPFTDRGSTAGPRDAHAGQLAAAPAPEAVAGDEAHRVRR